MHSRVIRNKKLGFVTVRALRNGDTRTICTFFRQLGEESRLRRFHGAKPRLSDAELADLAMVDSRRHSLVAYVEGDPRPAGVAQLVRESDRCTHAEIAFAVADRYQGQGIGRTLVELLAADARAAGVTHLTATIQSSNTAARALVQKVLHVVDVRQESGEATIVAGLAAGV
jgi:ribosomal protein S18 acetylase RimI-like enzyme